MDIPNKVCNTFIPYFTTLADIGNLFTKKSPTKSSKFKAIKVIETKVTDNSIAIFKPPI